MKQENGKATQKADKQSNYRQHYRLGHWRRMIIDRIVKCNVAMGKAKQMQMQNAVCRKAEQQGV